MVTGKIVLITGGGSGIGAAAGAAFVRQGAAHVVLADRDIAGAERVAAEIGGASASAQEVDVSDEAAVEALVDSIVADHGRIDVAFNNAGVNDSMSQFHDLGLDRWNTMIAVNLTAVFLCMKHELRHMAAAGSGSIINTSSGAGVVAAPGLPHYTAAKHGVVGLTKAAAQEYANQGIRVNAVLPGSTDTPMIRSFIGDDEGIAKLIAGSNIQGELLAAADIADVAVWLGSDGSRMVNGQSIIVDGGGIVR